MVGILLYCSGDLATSCSSVTGQKYNYLASVGIFFGNLKKSRLTLFMDRVGQGFPDLHDLKACVHTICF